MSKERVLLEVDVEKLERWKRITEIRKKADDHTICPKCQEQILFCDCAERLADEVLSTSEREELFFDSIL